MSNNEWLVIVCLVIAVFVVINLEALVAPKEHQTIKFNNAHKGKKMNEQSKLKIEIVRLSDTSKLPTRATEGSAGMDVYANITEPVEVPAGWNRLIPTGIAISINDSSIVAVLAGRSGLALKKQVRLANSVGIIDSDFKDEIGIIIRNDGWETFTVNPQDRIAQLLFMPVIQIDWAEVKEFSEGANRGGGFGSTGVAAQ